MSTPVKRFVHFLYSDVGIDPECSLRGSLADAVDRWESFAIHYQDIANAVRHRILRHFGEL